MWYTTCRWVQDLDQPEVDYIVNVLAVAGEDFDFGMDDKGAFEALGKLLVTADFVSDFSECHAVSFLFSFHFFCLVACEMLYYRID